MESSTSGKAPPRTVQKQSRKWQVRKQQYLLFYNLISGFLWFAVLARTVAILSIGGPKHVHEEVGEFTKWTQSLAVLEVVHSAVGLVRSPILTTTIQISSRILLVWGIAHPYPSITVSPFYSSMLLAWSITEVIRYFYFFRNLQSGVPAWLQWLRYNTFFVLYPIGIMSEFMMIWKAREQTNESLVKWGLGAILAAYVPGSWVMYSHMMRQRRKINKGKAVERSRAPTI